jgi:bacterioferritin-associated ferredoxin
MYVCICNGITDKQVRQAAKAGVRNLWGLQMELGVASNCGSCKDVAMEIIRETAGAPHSAEPVIYHPSAAAAPATS